MGQAAMSALSTNTVVQTLCFKHCVRDREVANGLSFWSSKPVVDLKLNL
jgi:hypothetical protein